MKTASVKQFVALRAALLNEKSQLEARLKEICVALEVTASVPSSKPGAGPKKRAENALSLREAVEKAVASKPLTKPDILKAVGGLGYKFTASNPMMSLNTLLYTPGKFKKHSGGKWGPLKK